MGQEREKLSVDLADKALTIKKLLEDNQYLRDKLEKAKRQTEEIINEAKRGRPSRGGMVPTR